MLTFRQVFDRVEAAVSHVALRAVNSPEVGSALLVANRYGHAAINQISEVRSALVHVFALPSQRDLRLVTHRVASLQVAVAEIEARLPDPNAHPS